MSGEPTFFQPAKQAGAEKTEEQRVPKTKDPTLLQHLDSERLSSDNVDLKENERQRLREKQAQWNKKLAELEIPDRFGYVIDAGVKDTVAALQLLGFNTTQSDQGNYSYQPWVQVEADEAKDIYIGEPEAKARLMEERGVHPDEIDRQSPSFDYAKQVDIQEDARAEFVRSGGEYTEEFKTWRKETLAQAERLQNVIDEFYTTHEIPAGFEDLRVALDFTYRTSLHKDIPYIHDVPHLHVDFAQEKDTAGLSDEEYQALRARCQSEMRRFTEFLRGRFFSLKSVDSGDLREENLNDEETVERILEEGDPVKLEKLKAFHHLSSEQVELFGRFARLRKETLGKMKTRFKERILNDPEPTQEEWNMGVYREEIEPQVRDAVLIMRKKGYNTYESGFYGHDRQRIGFSETVSGDFQLPEQIRKLATEKGLTVMISSDAIELIYSRYVELDGIKEVWDAIANSLPIVGEVDRIAETGAAESFRRRVENIKANPQAFVTDEELEDAKRRVEAEDMGKIRALKDKYGLGKPSR